jgi:hypothetical protein
MNWIFDSTERICIGLDSALPYPFGAERGAELEQALKVRPLKRAHLFKPRMKPNAVFSDLHREALARIWPEVRKGR